MMRSLPRWAGRMAALALLFALGAAVYLFAVAPTLAAYERTHQDLREHTELLARYQRIAATRPALEAQLAELQVRQAESGVYLSGATDALAAAELQDRVNAIIQASGGALTSTQALPVKTEGVFRRISVRAQFTGTIEALHQAVYDLEANKPYLLVDNIDVRNRQRRRRANQPEGVPNLTIRLDLYGYLRPEAR